MAGGSGSVPGGSKGSFHAGGQGYGRKDGSNPWMTAEQARTNRTIGKGAVKQNSGCGQLS